MLTTFQGNANLDVLYQAARIESFDTIKNLVLGALESNTDISTEQKLAIRLAAAGLAPDIDGGFNNALLSILYMVWDAVPGATAVTSLTSDQRAGIIAAVMGICKEIITAEAARLTALAALDTTLPADWDAPPA